MTKKTKKDVVEREPRDVTADPRHEQLTPFQRGVYLGLLGATAIRTARIYLNICLNPGVNASQANNGVKGNAVYRAVLRLEKVGLIRTRLTSSRQRQCYPVGEEE